MNLFLIGSSYPPEEITNKLDLNEKESLNVYANFQDSNLENYSNKVLTISEKEKKVYLPYTNSEIFSYIEQFPKEYRSPEDVIKKEFILPLDYYMKHPVLSRFRESYSLIRDREAMPVIDAIKYSANLIFKYDLNPTIIAACKTQNQLEQYLDCLDNNKLNEFQEFEIRFEINPLAM